MLRKSRFIGLALNNKLSGASLVYYEMLPTVNVSSFEGSRQKGGFFISYAQDVACLRLF